MKKVALMLASLLVIMLAGCGEGSSSSGGSSADSSDSIETSNPSTGSNQDIEGSSVVVQQLRTPTATEENPFNLSPELGKPPALPSN